MTENSQNKGKHLTKMTCHCEEEKSRGNNVRRRQYMEMIDALISSLRSDPVRVAELGRSGLDPCSWVQLSWALYNKIKILSH